MKHNRMTAIFCAALLGVGAMMLPAAADFEEDAPCISPAIRVLAARTTMKKNGVFGEEMHFSQEEFSTVLGYTPTEITLRTLPDPMTGVLKLGGMTLAAGSRLSVSVLPGLRFVPTAGTADTDAAVPTAASFTFTAAGSAYETAVPLSCELYLMTAPNAAPTVGEQHVTTYEGIAASAGLRAADPEADVMTYEIVRPPKRGTVTLSAADGQFVYTPADGARGGDVFSWCATDAWGNRSDVVRTTVTVRRADDGLYYADLDGHPCAAAAMRLTEDGIFSGTVLGEHAFFAPDTPMTRGEFLVCAMRAAGYDGTADGDGAAAVRAVFANADAVPDWLLGTLAEAVEAGIVRGGTDASGMTVYDYDGGITRAEAAVLLYRLFDVGVPAVIPVFSEEEEQALPAWSVGAYASVCAAGIMSPDDPGGLLDRAMCAQILSAAMDNDWNKK